MEIVIGVNNMATSGIIFFENGDTQIFGQLVTVRGIAQAINTILPDLLAQERDQLLSTITQDELKQIIDKLSNEKDE